MANLVIFRERPAGEHIDLSAPIDDVPVDDVSRLHPSRVILLHHARGAPEDRKSTRLNSSHGYISYAVFCLKKKKKKKTTAETSYIKNESRENEIYIT